MNSAPSPQQKGDPTLSQRPAGRSALLKTLMQWHWISSAFCLIGMLVFSVTGFTLNHSSQIEAQPRVVTAKGELPQPVLVSLQSAVVSRSMPESFSDWAQRQWGVSLNADLAEWSPEELYVPMPRPGGDAWLRIDLASGEGEYEVTDRGWISYLNDLHKGRNTGAAWSWFIDLFALMCLVFCITGLLILKMHAINRPLTWPLVGMGFVLPVLLVLLFVH